MTYIFPPPPVVSLPVLGSDERFPVRRVFCIGRNYADHAKEMGSDPTEPPVMFTKPADAVVPVDESWAAVIDYPPETENLHYEGELVVALRSGGADIAAQDAASCVFGYAVGVDLTRRDLQQAAGKTGNPWDMGKGFDQSAPTGVISPMPGKLLEKGRIRLDVDGETRQDSDLAKMIWPVAPIVSVLSKFVRLAPGDLIFTGTPEGVGPVTRGQRIEAMVEGLAPIAFTMR